MASPLVAALMDPNNIGMSEADHGGFGSTADKLKQGVIGRMFHGLATLPARAGQAAVDYGDPLKGTYDPAPIMEGAMTAMTGGMPFAQVGAAGIFGGKLAKTADHAALARAEDMAAKGAPREQIWNDTGWFRGADDKWRFEIPDNNAHASIAGRHNLAEDRAGGPIAGYLWHSPLYEAYPNLRRTTVDTNVPGDAGGVSRGGSIGILPNYGRGREENARSIMLHEVQHEVQRPEGFMVGNAPKPVPDMKSLETDFNYFNDAHTILNEAKRIAGLNKIEELSTLPRDKFSETMSQAADEFRQAFGRGAETGGALHQVRFGSDRADSIKWVLETYDDLTKKITEQPHQAKKAFDDYWRQASEVEARNVQRRMQMTPEERRAAPPWTTEDVYPGGQIIGDILK
jgi:uncharacterized Zn-binding protein involved in type VI secretion